MTPFRPMLAGKPDFETLRYPLLASPKVDGIRMTVHNGVGMSRSMKPLGNAYLQSWVQAHRDVLQGMDGEVVVGKPYGPDVYDHTSGAIRRADGEPDFTFYVFDLHDRPAPFAERFAAASQAVATATSRFSIEHLDILPHDEIRGPTALDVYESDRIAQGYEGIMTRDPAALYKQGRATAIGQELLKIKRYEDEDCVVLGLVEEMHNENAAMVSSTGRTVRSSHQENKVGKGSMGALNVRGVKGRWFGTEFQIGTGFTAEQRRLIWHNPHLIVGETVTFKYFPVGSADRPRHPVFLRIRQPE